MAQAETIEQLRLQLHDLQSQLAFQEDTISALDAVVTRQQRQIDRLQALWDTQQERLEQVLIQLENGPPAERPPHY